MIPAIEISFNIYKLDQKVSNVLKDSPTHWNFSYYILEDWIASRAHRFIIPTISYRNNNYDLNNEMEMQNNLIQTLVKVLKPLQDTTKTYAQKTYVYETLFP